MVGAEATLTEAADLGIDKGELFIAQVSGSGPSARIVAAERITTQQ